MKLSRSPQAVPALGFCGAGNWGHLERHPVPCDLRVPGTQLEAPPGAGMSCILTWDRGVSSKQSLCGAASGLTAGGPGLFFSDLCWSPGRFLKASQVESLILTRRCSASFNHLMGFSHLGSHPNSTLCPAWEGAREADETNEDTAHPKQCKYFISCVQERPHSCAKGQGRNVFTRGFHSHCPLTLSSLL